MERDCVAVATEPLFEGRCPPVVRVLQNRTSVQLELFDSGLNVLQARLGGVCTGRGLS